LAIQNQWPLCVSVCHSEETLLQHILEKSACVSPTSSLPSDFPQFIFGYKLKMCFQESYIFMSVHLEVKVRLEL